MNEVSCRALGVMFNHLARRGLDVRQLLRDLPLPAEHLLDPNNRVDWELFLEVVERLRPHYPTPESWRDIGASIFEGPQSRVLAALYRLFPDPMLMQRQSFRFGGQRMFNNMSARVSEEGERLFLDLSLLEPYRPSPEYFLICEGSFGVFPKLLGLPSVPVEMTIDGRHAHYVVRYDLFPQMAGRRRGLVGLARRQLRSLRDRNDLVAEFEQGQLLLESRYHELENAKRTLQLVHEITTAAIRNQRLAPMVEAIADELYRGMGLAALEVSVGVSEEGIPFQATQVRGDRATLDRDGVVETLGEPPWGRLRVSRWPGTLSPADREVLRQVAQSAGLALTHAVTFEVNRSFRHDLESRVAHRTAQLSEARDQIGRSLESRNRFFANVNHEIRTPLTVLLLGLDRLSSLAGPRSDLDEPIESMRRNAERLRTLVDELLLLASGAEVGARLRLGPVSVATLVEEVVAALRPNAVAKGLELHSEYSPGLVLEGDGRALDRALFNLVSNAIKYTGEGRIAVRARAEAAAILLEVEDTGEGIPEDFIVRVFERFVQVPGAKSRPGAGIGLALVKEIAAQHGGSVSVASRVGHGSRFTLRLPARASEELRDRSELALGDLARSPAEPPAAVLSPPVDASSFRGWAKVLLCEDHRELGEHTRDLLADAGMRVTLVGSAEEALESARRDPPDLLLTDLGLPGPMDGLELCAAFDKLAGHLHAPCLVLTANSVPSVRLRALEAGAVDYIVKPFTPDDLLARVNAQLRLRKVTKQLLASERLAAQGAALAGAAHELRNPINALVNAIEPLRRALPEGSAPAGSLAHELMDIVKDCGLRVARLSYELLSMTRADGSGVAEQLDLSELLARSRRVLEPQLRRVELRLDLQRAGPVRASGVQLGQVLCNLVENAVDAAGTSGWVEVRTRTDGERAVLEVADSGPGIPMELRQRVFEPFFTTKEPGKGTGLGLSISRTIVRRFGGDIELAEHPGPSLIRIWLPRSDGVIEAPVPTA